MSARPAGRARGGRWRGLRITDRRHAAPVPGAGAPVDRPSWSCWPWPPRPARTVALTAPALLVDLGLRRAAGDHRGAAAGARPSSGRCPRTAPRPDRRRGGRRAGRRADAVPGRFTGIVLDAAGGDPLWERSAGTRARARLDRRSCSPRRPRCSPSTRRSSFVTRVVAGPDPGTVVLVGGGDPTLTALPAGKGQRLPGRRRGWPSSPSRCKQAVPAADHQGDGRHQPLHRADAWPPGWDAADIAGGYITPIEPLMLDGGRIDADAAGRRRGCRTRRSTAGRAFAGMLGVDPDSGGRRHRPAGRRGARRGVLGAGRPSWSSTLLRSSDNVLAEVLAREVALARGGEPSLRRGAPSRSLAALEQAGHRHAPAPRCVDGSGLSTRGPGAGPAARRRCSPRRPRRRRARATRELLRPLVTGLPVAGGDGTLDDRFAPDAARRRPAAAWSGPRPAR